MLFEHLVLYNLILTIPCLLIMLTFLCVLIYVDHLLITGNSVSVLNKLKASLSTTFNMKDLRPLKYFGALKLPAFLLEFIFVNNNTP